MVAQSTAPLRRRSTFVIRGCLLAVLCVLAVSCKGNPGAKGTGVDGKKQSDETCPSSLGSPAWPAPPSVPLTEEGVGTIVGHFGVTPSGEASYAIPLIVPPGPAGMQPSLTLEYRAGSGDSYVGTGFSIGGLSSITRCPRTFARDHVVAAVRYDGTDEYCLDGKRLVVAFDHGAEIEYRTRPDTSVQIFGQKSTTSGDDPYGNVSFYVLTKEGLRLDYGTDTSSSVFTNIPTMTGPNVVRTWLLAKISSPVTSATVDFNYDSSTAADGHTMMYEPDTITYSGRTIQFAYAPKPPGDRRTTFEHGMYMLSELALTSIAMTVPGDPVAARVYRFSYESGPVTRRTLLQDLQECWSVVFGVCKPPTHFDWHSSYRKRGDSGSLWTAVTSPLRPPVASHGASFMTMDVTGDGLDDVVSADVSQPLGPYTTFSVSRNTGKPPYFAATQVALTQPMMESLPVTADSALVERGAAIDYDQDGLQDLLLHDVGGVYADWQVLLARRDASNGVTFQRKATGVTRPFDGAIPANLTSVNGAAHLVDVNGDGVADLLHCHGDGTGYWKWELHYWKSALASGEPGFDTAPIAVQSSTMDFTLLPCTLPVHVLDVDHDGRGDLVLPKVIHTDVDGTMTFGGVYFSASLDEVTGDWRVIDTKLPLEKAQLPVFVDINGDGLPDAVEDQNVPNNLLVYVNTGGTFAAGVGALSSPPQNTLGAKLSLAAPIDVDGDGRQDLLLPLSPQGSPPRWYVLRATGGTSPPFEVIANALPADITFNLGQDPTLSFPLAPRVTDVNGDGANDVLLYVGPTLKAFVSTLFEEDALKAVTDGMNARAPGDAAFVPNVSLRYGHTIDSAITDGLDEGSGTAESRMYLAHWDPANTCIYPRRCAVGSRRVVQSYVLNNGADVGRTFNVTYRDGRSDSLGRGWLGFGTRMTIDGDTGAGSADSYDNIVADHAYGEYLGAGVLAAERRWVPASLTDPVPSRVDLSIDTWQREALYDPFIPTCFSALTSHASGVYQGSFSPGAGQTLWQWVRSADQSGAATELSTTADSFSGYDTYGNPTSAKTVTPGVDLTTTVAWSYSLVEPWGERPAAQTTCSTVGGVAQCRTDDRTYDTVGHLLTRVLGSGDGPQTTLKETLGYDAFNNVVSRARADTFGNHSLECAAYDPSGVFAIAVRDAMGHATHSRYEDRFGVRTAQMDPNGEVTQWAYDQEGRVIEEVRPDGAKTTWARAIVQDAAHGHVTQEHVVTTGGADTLAQFDELGRETMRSSASIQHYCASLCLATPNVVQSTEYEKLQPAVRRISVPTFALQLPQSVQWTTWDHDAAGRVVAARAPWTDGLTTYLYDGNTTKISEPGSVSRSIEVDARGRTVRVTDAAGLTLSAYGPFDALTQVMVPDGTSTTYQRDAMGNLTSKVTPDQGLTKWTYDGFGRLTGETDAAGRATQYKYDAGGRPLQRIDDDGATTWLWDAAAHGIGALAEIQTAPSPSTPPTSRREFAYTPAGQLQSTTLILGAEAFETSFTFDTFGRVQTVTYPAANGIPGLFAAKNQYDAYGHLNRVANATTGQPIWTLTAADAQGNVTGEAFGNGVASSRSFLPDKDRVSTIQSTLGASALQNLAYAWDGRRNLTSRKDALQGEIESFQYDPLDRLVCATFSAPTDPCTLSVAYDASGNITSKSDVGPYGYDPFNKPHAVRSAGAGSFDYDLVGNQIVRPDATVTYTAANLPRKVTPTNQTPTTYQYDGLQGRIARTTPDASSVYQSDLYERVTHAAGGVDHEYSVHAAGRVVAVFTRRVNEAQKGTYILADHLGSPDVLTDDSGAVVERRSYDAFGQRRNPQWGQPWGGASSTFPVAYTGQHDDILGLVDMKGRIYDPRLARFLEPDPLVTAPHVSQSWNRYSYVRNDPLSRIDPSGFIDQPPAAPASSPPASGDSNWLADEISAAMQAVQAAASIVIDTLEAWAAESDARPLATDMASTGSISMTVSGVGVIQVTGTAKVEVDPSMAFSDFMAEAIAAGREIPDVPDTYNPDPSGFIEWVTPAWTPPPSPEYPQEKQWGIERFMIPVAGVDLAADSLLADSTVLSAEQRAIFAEMRANEAADAAAANEAPMVTLRGTNRATTGGVVTDRGTFRVPTLQKVWDAAAKGPNGGRLCPTCLKEVLVPPGSSLPSDWDGSHFPSWTTREFPLDVTRQQVIDNYNEDVFLECPSCNRPRGNRD